VVAYLDGMGWMEFVHKQEIVYPALVLEFISSFSATLKLHDVDFNPTMKFRCLGQNRELSLDQFHSILGFAIDGLFRVPYTGVEVANKGIWNAAQFWRIITNQPQTFSAGK